MNSCKFVLKYNKTLECLNLIFTHLTCIVLQPRKFYCHYSKLQGENFSEINNLVEIKKSVSNSVSSSKFDVSRRGIRFATAA